MSDLEKQKTARSEKKDDNNMLIISVILALLVGGLILGSMQMKKMKTQKEILGQIGTAKLAGGASPTPTAQTAQTTQPPNPEQKPEEPEKDRSKLKKLSINPENINVPGAPSSGAYSLEGLTNMAMQNKGMLASVGFGVMQFLPRLKQLLPAITMNFGIAAVALVAAFFVLNWKPTARGGYSNKARIGFGAAKLLMLFGALGIAAIGLFYGFGPAAGLLWSLFGPFIMKIGHSTGWDQYFK